MNYEVWLYWIVTVLNCYLTELWLYWTVTWLNCYLTDHLLLDWPSVTLRIYYFTNLLLYESITLRIYYFTDLLLYGSITLRIYYFRNLLLYESITLRIYYFTNLLLYESITLRIYYFTNLLLYESITLRIDYFTNRLLYESITLRIDYFTNLLLYGSITLRIYYFTNLLLYESITLRIYYFTNLLLWAFLKVRNSEVSHPNFLWLCSGSSFLVTKKRLGSSILQIFMANAAPKLTRAVHTTCRTKQRQGQGAPRLQTNLAALQRETCPHMFQLTKRSCPPFSAPLQPCMTWRSQSSSHGPEHTGRSNGGLPSGEKPKSAYVILSHATYGVIQFHSKSYRQY